MANCHPFGNGPFGQGAFGGCEQQHIHPDCGFGNEPFGWGPFGMGCKGKYVVKGFKVWAAYDGPQMVMTWTAPEKPEEVGRVRILRKEREYPKSTTDPEAVTVFDTVDPTVTKFTDTSRNTAKLGADPTPGVVYYYRAFTETLRLPGDLYDDNGDGSEGFDYCYDESAHDLSYVFDPIDDAVWYHLIPDSWGLEDVSTSQQTLSMYTDPTTDERTVLLDKAHSEGFAQRFVRIWTLLFWRSYAHARTIRDVWDVWAVRADALRHLAEVLGARIDERDTFNVWRRNLLDVVGQHRAKGSKTLLAIAVEQVVGPDNPITIIEMWTRIHSAWNPQSPDDETLSPGLIKGADADKVDLKDDPNTYCWNPKATSSYNERGWRVYLDKALTEDTRARLGDVLKALKPVVVTAEIWEAGTLTRQEI